MVLLCMATGLHGENDVHASLSWLLEVLNRSVRGRSRILVRGPQLSLDPRGGLSPKCAQNRGFSIKIA